MRFTAAVSRELPWYVARCCLEASCRNTCASYERGGPQPRQSSISSAPALQFFLPGKVCPTQAFNIATSVWKGDGALLDFFEGGAETCEADGIIPRTFQEGIDCLQDQTDFLTPMLAASRPSRASCASSRNGRTPLVIPHQSV